MTENIPKDIVARLRAPCPRVFACMDSTRAEAADEIERRRALIPLAREVLDIADGGILPDGDGVNVPTLLWAESWEQKLKQDAAALCPIPLVAVERRMIWTQSELDACEQLWGLGDMDRALQNMGREITRLRECLERIAEHHEAQWSHWLNDDMARYHQHRRDVAMAYMTEAAK